MHAQCTLAHKRRRRVLLNKPQTSLFLRSFGKNKKNGLKTPITRPLSLGGVGALGEECSHIRALMMMGGMVGKIKGAVRVPLESG